MTPSPFQKQIRFLQNRLSPQGYAGLHLTVGALVVLICGWCFGEIAEDVSHGEPIVQVDRYVAVWFHQYASPIITQVARAISFFGSVGWLTAVSIGVALFLVLRRDWLNASLIALVMGGGGALNVVLKHFFHRERPVLENPLVTLSSYGFPQRAHHGSDSALRFTRVARLEKPPEPRRASGLCSGCLLLDPAHRAHPDLSGSPLPNGRSRCARGRPLLAGVLLDCIRNLASATPLNPMSQLLTFAIRNRRNESLKQSLRIRPSFKRYLASALSDRRLQRSVANLFVDREIIGSRRTKSIKHARR